ncbi:site-specific integrase [Brucepastera parasyntrophica]|uniref:tyrosine-type recombinase/integrase n=1 Tax=Brucepastera parasyntrophica TaxID=2880008 RepID=UPI00210E3C20|nr:site-specific integrase [Brucepastera parasyntrophica]ULQ60290.1 site-specific integrase [Brucepastera parasyntrophica]
MMNETRENVTRRPFSFHKRGNGYLYVQFWDAENQKYTTARSTGCTLRKEAEIKCYSWLREYGGLPPITKQPKNNTVSNSAIIKSIREYLITNGIINKDEDISIETLMNYLSLTLNGISLTKTNPFFVEYLLEFWDWEKSAYIIDRLESGFSIGKSYVKDNLSKIKNYAVPFFNENLRIQDITTDLIEKFKKQLPRGQITNKTINSILLAVKKPLDEAKRLNYISINPADSVKLLANQSKEKGILTTEEVRRLFSFEWQDKKSMIANMLACSTGLRAGEIGALRIQDLDTEKNIVNVSNSFERKEKKLKNPKNGKTRKIVVGPELMQKLVALYKENPYENGEFIFWGLKENSPMYIGLFARSLQKNLSKIGISVEKQKERNITFHSHRHFCNTLLRKHITDNTVRKFIGHSSQEMTNHYDHITEDEITLINEIVTDNILPLFSPGERTA